MVGETWIEICSLSFWAHRAFTMVPSMDPISTFFINTNFNLWVIRTHLLKCNKLSQLVMESIKKELTWWQAPGSRQWGANHSIVMNNPSINKSTTTGFCIFWALGVNGHFWALGVNGHFWALGVNGHFWALGVNGHFWGPGSHWFRAL